MILQFSDDVEEVYRGLEERLDANKALSREESTVVDVMRSIGGVQGDGLHQFWTCDSNAEDVVESFRIIGRSDIAQLFDEVRWSQNCLQCTDTGELFYDLTNAQSAEMSAVERKLYDSFETVPIDLQRHIAKHNIGG